METEGWKIAGLSRLSPLFPFTPLNFAFGIPGVKMVHDIPGSWIGMKPGTVTYVNLGSPGKAIIRAARAVAAVREAGEFGVHVALGTRADFGKVTDRVRRLRDGISPHDLAHGFTGLGVDIFLGAGKFTGPDTVEVAISQGCHCHRRSRRRFLA